MDTFCHSGKVFPCDARIDVDRGVLRGRAGHKVREDPHDPDGAGVNLGGDMLPSRGVADRDQTRPLTDPTKRIRGIDR